jgi:hypothetical protein
MIDRMGVLGRPVVFIDTIHRYGEALVLVIVICFGGWLCVGAGLSRHHRCGALGLFRVAFWCSSSPLSTFVGEKRGSMGM